MNGRIIFVTTENFFFLSNHTYCFPPQIYNKVITSCNYQIFHLINRNWNLFANNFAIKWFLSFGDSFVSWLEGNCFMVCS